MGKNLVIISEAETFSVRGIEMKLQGIGMTTVYAEPKLMELEKKLEGADLIVLYTDTEIVTKNNVLIYLWDYCVDNEINMMVIGSKSEYEDVKKIIKDAYIAGFFDRPLDMNVFLDELEKFCSEDHKQRKSILIVDDNVTYMSMIMDWLKDS